MKARIFIIVIILVVALSVFCLESLFAAREKPHAVLKIGVVSVKEVFDNCAMKGEVEKTLAAEGEKRFAELKKLEQEIETEKATLNKLKENSQDYLDTLKSVMLKQSQFDAQKEYFQQELAIKEMRGKEKIYRKILEAIAYVAKEKDLDIVLNRDDNYLNRPDAGPPAQSPSDLILTTKTHKLLYFNPNLDITDEVIGAMGRIAGGK